MVAQKKTRRRDNYNLGICAIVFSIPVLIADIQGVIFSPTNGCFILSTVYAMLSFYAGLGTGLVGIFKDKRYLPALVGVILISIEFTVYMWLLSLQDTANCL